MEKKKSQKKSGEGTEKDHSNQNRSGVNFVRPVDIEREAIK